MKWTFKNLQLLETQHRQIDGVWMTRDITTSGDAEVTLDDTGLDLMARRALKNSSGKSRDGYLNAKAFKRHTETSEWTPSK